MRIDKIKISFSYEGNVWLYWWVYFIINITIIFLVLSIFYGGWPEPFTGGHVVPLVLLFVSQAISIIGIIIYYLNERSRINNDISEAFKQIKDAHKRIRWNV